MRYQHWWLQHKVIHRFLMFEALLKVDCLSAEHELQIYIPENIYLSYLYSASPQILHRIRSAVQGLPVFHSIMRRSHLLPDQFPGCIQVEPPPPRSTPWGAYRWHNSCIHISTSAWQPGETNNVSELTLLHLLQSHNHVAEWSLGMFQWSMFFYVHQSHKFAHTPTFLQVGEYSHRPEFHHVSTRWQQTSGAWWDSNLKPSVWQANA